MDEEEIINEEIETSEQDEQEDNEEESELLKLRRENEQLKMKTQKLLEKKHKAIAQKKTNPTANTDIETQFQSMYQKMREKERFESENPGVDFEIAKVISEAKGVDITEAIHYIRAGGSYRIGQDKIPEVKNEDEARKERLKKMLKLD